MIPYIERVGPFEFVPRLREVKIPEPNQFQLWVGIRKRVPVPAPVATPNQVAEGVIIQSPGLPDALIVGGKRLAFADALTIAYCSKTVLRVSKEVYEAVPYGASIHKGQAGAISSGGPGGWQTIENGVKMQWLMDTNVPLLLNGSTLPSAPNDAGVTFTGYLTTAKWR